MPASSSETCWHRWIRCNTFNTSIVQPGQMHVKRFIICLPRKMFGTVWCCLLGLQSTAYSKQLTFSQQIKSSLEWPAWSTSWIITWPPKHLGQTDTQLTASIYRTTWISATEVFWHSGALQIGLLLLLLSSWLQKSRKAYPIWILMKQEMTGWHWHQLDHVQIISTSLRTDNHASTSSLNFHTPDALSDAQPTTSKQWRQKKNRQCLLSVQSLLFLKSAVCWFQTCSSIAYGICWIAYPDQESIQLTQVHVETDQWNNCVWAGDTGNTHTTQRSHNNHHKWLNVISDNGTTSR